MTRDEESTVTHKSPCPKCVSNGRDNSGDNLANYSDGHSYCFSCCSYFPKGVTGLLPEVKPVAVSPKVSAFAPQAEEAHGGMVLGVFKELPHRGLHQSTCQLYDYRTLGTKEIESFLVEGVAIAQHIRTTDPKGFYWIGPTKALPLWGQWLFPKGGKRLLITEGAIDCMTMSQLFGNKYPVVSIPNGVASAVKSCRENYEFIASFETVVICFDMDPPGQAAARAVADILPPGKVRIMKMSKKDPNEMLLAAESTGLLTAYWNAPLYSPDSILHVSSILNTPKTASKVYEYPWESLTTFLIGQDAGRLNLWAAAPGQGKTSFIREIVVQHLQEGRSVGCIFLEESPEQTVDDIISLMIQKPVRRIRAQNQLNILRESFGKEPIQSGVTPDLDEDEYTKASEELSKLPLYLYDHIGNAEISSIMSRLDYMAVGLGCQVLVIDHITLLGNMLLSNTDTIMSNERLVLDEVMKHLRALVERTGCIIHVISHIKKSEKNVDEGAPLSLGDLRGSGSLAQIADNVFSLERNRQHQDSKIQNTTMIRVLKNRKTGKCGVASALLYNSYSSTLEEVGFTITAKGEVTYTYAPYI